MTISPLQFDLRRAEIPVTLSDGLEEIKCVVKEADGETSRVYKNALLDNATISPEGTVSKLPGVADQEILLVQLCLFYAGADGVSPCKNVPKEIVMRWPDRVVHALSEKIKEISPGLADTPDTLEELEKQRIELDKKIGKMKGENEDDVGNS